MTTIYAVEQGSYSDYHVVGVFSTRENAELFVEALKESYDVPSIAEWQLDPCVEELRAGLKRFSVVMLRDGTVERCVPCELSSYEVGTLVANIWRRSIAPAFRGKGLKDALNCTVFARDEQHAIKITNERRTQMIATGGWKP